jgi:hypothetical protein
VRWSKRTALRELLQWDLDRQPQTSCQSRRGVVLFATSQGSNSDSVLCIFWRRGRGRPVTPHSARFSSQGNGPAQRTSLSKSGLDVSITVPYLGSIVSATVALPVWRTSRQPVRGWFMPLLGSVPACSLIGTSTLLSFQVALRLVSIMNRGSSRAHVHRRSHSMLQMAVEAHQGRGTLTGMTLVAVEIWRLPHAPAKTAASYTTVAISCLIKESGVNTSATEDWASALSVLCCYNVTREKIRYKFVSQIIICFVIIEVGEEAL